MAQIKYLSFWAISGLLGLMISVSPIDAQSNFSAWLNLVGINSLPEWVRAESFDYVIFIAWLLSAMLFFFAPKIQSKFFKKKQLVTVKPPTKEDTERWKNTLEKQGARFKHKEYPPKIIEKTYATYVGRMYYDLIINWNENGIQKHAGLFGFVTPESYRYYYYLKDLGVDLTVDKNLREDIYEFLSHFLAHRSPMEGMLANCYIKTVYDTEEELLEYKDDIEELATSLSERLKYVKRAEENRQQKA